MQSEDAHRRLESVEGQLAKHALASAPNLDARRSLWGRKQVSAPSLFLQP